MVQIIIMYSDFMMNDTDSSVISDEDEVSDCERYGVYYCNNNVASQQQDSTQEKIDIDLLMNKVQHTSLNVEMCNLLI